MKKIITLILLSLLIPRLSAQDAQKNFSFEKGHTPSDYGFTKGGDFYIQTIKLKLVGEAKETTFRKYNSKTLDLDYLYKPTKKNNLLETSPKGEKVLFENSNSPNTNLNVLNEKGEVKEYNGDEWIPKKLVVIERFISKDYYVALGHNEKDKKNYQMFVRDINTFESSTVSFNLPEGASDKEGVVVLQVINHTNDSFTILTKNFKDGSKEENHQTQEYILAEYNYQGKLIKQQSLITKINNTNLTYYPADTGNDSYKTYTRRIRNPEGQPYYKTYYIPNVIATGNIYIDEENKNYYTYGIISSEKSKYGSGFMINKFSFSGELLWTKKEMITTKKEKLQLLYGAGIEVNLFLTKNKIGFVIKNREGAYIFQIDSENGKTLLQKKFDKIKVYNINGFGNISDRISTPEFVSHYILKEIFTKKVIVDIHTLASYFLNDEFKNYIDGLKTTNNKLNIISSINKSGIRTIQADNKNDDFKLLYFKW